MKNPSQIAELLLGSLLFAAILAGLMVLAAILE